MEKNYSYIDSANVRHDIVLDDKSFQLQQKDTIIKDKSLMTKPTTFLKDAFRRFCKSKAAIVSSIILGVIVLLSLIIPVALPFDTTGATTSGMQYLSPKLFPAGTGFWDGTKKYSDLIYDSSTGLPDGDFDSTAILEGSLKTYAGTIENTPTKLASGGYIRIASSGGSEYVWSASKASIDNSKSVTLSYDVENGILDNYGDVPFYISLVNNDGMEIRLVENSSEFGTKTDVDVSSKLKSYSSLDLSDLTLRVGFVSDKSETMLAVFLKSISVKNGGTEINAFTMNDANAALLNETFKKNSSNLSGLSKADITYCSFVYDSYQVAYGNVEYTYSESDIQNFVDKGYMKYDFSVGVSSFEILDDLCPIIEVKSQTTKKIAGVSVTEVKVVVARYKQKGFASMPLHIFGTDANGIDMFKYVFEGLRNSLGVAILISAICFMFGLVFGAIEGYFGGTVDLLMERFVEVISNIPSIILITICVLHLGQNFGVFMLAMCITGWIGTSGITRTQFYRFKRREYVLASRSLGASDSRLIFHHILPNSMGTIITSSVLMIPSVIYSEATISYLGIGLSGQSSLGNILSSNQVNISSNQYLLVFPSALLAIMLICFNLFGNGLRDAFNPSLKGSE